MQPKKKSPDSPQGDVNPPIANLPIINTEGGCGAFEPVRKMWSTVQDMKDLVQILTPCVVFILAPETVSASSVKKKKKVSHAASMRLKNPTRELCVHIKMV